MIKRFVCVALATTFIATSAIAGDYVFAAKSGDGQKIEYDHGVATTFSTLPHSEVDLHYDDTFVGKRAEFVIVITNHSSDSVNIGVDNVSAKYAGETLHVYTADELAKIVKGRAAWAGFAVALAGGMDEALASTPTTSTTYGHVGNTYYSTNTTTYGTDYYAQAAARDRTNANLDQLTASRNATLDQISDTSLQMTTVHADQTYMSKFVIDRPKKLDGTPLEIVVTIGDDVHKFDFDVTKGS